MLRDIWFNPSFNQALRLTLGLLLWMVFALSIGEVQQGALSVLVLPSLLVSQLTLPSRYWWRRVGLALVAFPVVAACSAWLATNYPIGLPFWFISLALLMGSTSAWGELPGRLGRGTLIISILGMATSGQGAPWELALGYGACALWLVLFSALWYRLWRHYPLRQALGDVYARLATLMSERPERLRENRLSPHFDQPLGVKLTLCRNLMTGVLHKPDAAPLRSALAAALDFQERLQAMPHPERVSELLSSGSMYLLYRNWARRVAARLLRLSRELKQQRKISSSDALKASSTALVDALETVAAKGGELGMVAHYVAANVQRLTRLAERAAPLYQREWKRDTEPNPWQQWRKMMVWSSPVLRGATRLALIIGVAAMLTLGLELENGYWIMVTIVVVTESSFVATRARIWHRVRGTFAGLIVGGVLLYFGVTGDSALAIAALILPVTIFFVQINHGYTSAGISAMLVLMFDYLGLGAGNVLVPRLIDTVIGCALVFASYRWLWPQWQGGRQAALRRSAMTKLHRYLQLLLLSFQGKPVERMQLARARRLAYDEGVALTSSFNQMKQEPGYRNEGQTEAVLAMYKGAMSHLNAVAPLARRQFVLPEEQAERLWKVFDEAWRSLRQALDNDAAPWPESLANELSWLYAQLAEQDADRSGFLFYQLALLLERYQRMYQLVSQPERGSR